MKKHFKTSSIALLPVAVLVVLGSCTKADYDDDFTPGDPPPIGEWANSDEVAAANLVAYWPMDGNGNEMKSGTAPSLDSNATFTTGQKGQAVEFNYGLLAYPEIAALRTLPSYTISAWINTANRQGVPNRGGAQAIFQLTRLMPSGTANEWAGNVTFMMENDWYPPTNPILVVKGLNVTNVNGNASWQDTRNDPAKLGVQEFKGANKWVQVVLTWNGKDSLFQVYGNSEKISNPDWEKRGNGELVFFTPTKPVIGGWGTNVMGSADGWQQPFKGKIDEVRVYNKALTPPEIKALYVFEKQGR